MSELAFDTTKCGLPEIPKIPVLRLNDCDIRDALPVIPDGPSLLLAPSTGFIPNTAALDEFRQFFGLGVATTDIPINSTGLLTIYDCNNPTDKTVTVKTRLSPIKKGDPVYFYKFDCGPEIISSPINTQFEIGVLNTNLAAGTMTLPSTASASIYRITNGVPVDTGEDTTVYNHSPQLTGTAGQTIFFSGLRVNGARRFVVTNVDNTTGISTITPSLAGVSSINCCSGCVPSSTLAGSLYPNKYYLYKIPTTYGGDINGIIRLTMVSPYVWESDSFQFSCSGGTDRYYWRLSAGGAGSCNDGIGVARLKLMPVSVAHCPNQSLLDNSNQTTGLSSDFIYQNITPFRLQCGNTLYLNNDVCMPDAIQDQMSSTICVYPYSSTLPTGSTPGLPTSSQPIQSSQPCVVKAMQVTGRTRPLPPRLTLSMLSCDLPGWPASVTLPLPYSSTAFLGCYPPHFAYGGGSSGNLGSSAAAGCTATTFDGRVFALQAYYIQASVACSALNCSNPGNDAALYLNVFAGNVSYNRSNYGIVGYNGVNTITRTGTTPAGIPTFTFDPPTQPNIFSLIADPNNWDITFTLDFFCMRGSAIGATMPKIGTSTWRLFE